MCTWCVCVEGRRVLLCETFLGEVRTGVCSASTGSQQTTDHASCWVSNLGQVAEAPIEHVQADLAFRSSQHPSAPTPYEAWLAHPALSPQFSHPGLGCPSSRGSSLYNLATWVTWSFLSVVLHPPGLLDWLSPLCPPSPHGAQLSFVMFTLNSPSCPWPCSPFSLPETFSSTISRGTMSSFLFISFLPKSKETISWVYQGYLWVRGHVEGHW